MPLVSVGLVTWNSASHLPATLNALARQTHQFLELIVVDNASTDNSVSQVRTRFPSARIILNTDNRGFCGGHNQGIAASKGKYFLPLNPDVIMQPNYIEVLVESLEQHSECGSAAGKLLQEAGVIDTTGLFINRRRQQYLRGYGETDAGQYDTPGEVFGVDGAAPLYRRDMLEDIKIDGQYFDENFFSYKEDVDLAWRARMLGWSSYYDPKAVAIHSRTFHPGKGGTGREVLSHLARLHSIKNRYLLLIKNESLAGWQRDWAHILFYDLKILVFLVLHERDSLAAIPLLRRTWASALSWRRNIWRKARVNPSILLKWFQ